MAVAFHGLLEAAELDERVAARLWGGHARLKVVCDVHLEVAFEFFGELAVAATLLEELR